MKFFTKAAMDLLIENRLNDSKAFYDAHKTEMDTLVREPFYDLITAVAPSLQSCDPLIMDEPKRQLSRIRRDTRFTNDKTLYRAGAWCRWGRDKRHFDGVPEFYFELRAEYAWWGCGIYFAEPSYTDSYRKMILSRDPIFLAAKESIERQKTFILDGDVFKRTKFPDEPPDIRAWLDRKSIYVSHTETDPSVTFDRDMSVELIKDFRKILPYYEFLITAYDRRMV